MSDIHEKIRNAQMLVEVTGKDLENMPDYYATHLDALSLAAKSSFTSNPDDVIKASMVFFEHLDLHRQVIRNTYRRAVNELQLLLNQIDPFEKP